MKLIITALSLVLVVTLVEVLKLIAILAFTAWILHFGVNTYLRTK